MSKTVKLVFVFICISVVTALLPAQENQPEAAGAVVAPVEQDPIEALRQHTGEWWEVKETAGLFWKQGTRQESMRALLSEPGLSGKVFTGLAVHFAGVKERSVLKVILQAMAERDFENLNETLELHAIAAFHKHGSVLPEVDSALAQYSATAAGPAPAGFVRLCSLYTVLTEVTPENGGLSRDATRYRAIEKLLFLFDNPANLRDPKVMTAIQKQLGNLAGGFVSYESPAEWRAWFQNFKTDTDRDKQLSLERIAKESIAHLKSQYEQLATKRRAEVNDLIARMKTMGEPPTSFLLDDDAAVRRSALRVLRGMADELAAQQRTPAVQEITRLLESNDLDDERRRTLLEAAGALGRKLNKEERANLSTAIFKGPDGLGPEVWRARLSAIALIGVIDDPARLERVYDLANSPVNGPKPAWTAVRGDVLRACQTLKLDTKLAVRGLRDPDEEVRGAAASTLATSKTSWDEELARTLVDAAVAETGSTALTRMLEALRNIGRERAELLNKELLTAILSIEERASEANDARILGILLHASLSRNDNEVPGLDLVEGLLSRVFASGVSPGDRAQLTEQLLKAGGALGARLLTLILLETPAALDHDQTDRAVQIILQQEQGVVTAVQMIEMATKLAGRADMPPALRGREAAILAATALKRIRAGEASGGVDLDEQERRIQEWRLASGEQALITEARDALDAAVAAEPQSPRPLLERAAFLEGLYLRREALDMGLLAAAESDLRASLEFAGVMDEPARTRVNLDLARVVLLQGKLDDFPAISDRINESGAAEQALLYRHIHGVFASPGERALTILAGVGEEQMSRSRPTYALLRLAAHALSPRPEDQLAVCDLLTEQNTDFEKDLVTRGQILRALQATLAEIAPDAAPAEDDLKKLGQHPRLSTALVSRRLLALDDAQFDLQAEKFLPPVVTWLPELKAELSWEDPMSAAARAQLRKSCERLALLDIDFQKRRAQFLKLLALSLYSP